MSELLHSVLVVDDSPEDLRMLSGCLSEDYAVFAASSGEAALHLCEEHHLNVAVLDVDLPRMDGYEICRRLRAGNPHMQILFLSAHDGLDEILKGYDAGGNDYITKPFSPEILLSKIASALAAVSNVKRLEAEKNDASGAFMAALASMGDLGGVIHFLRESFRINASADLAALFFECTENFNLQVCLQLRSQFGDENFSSSGQVSQLEIELLNRVANSPERFLERGRRLFINYPSASVLIKNTPTDAARLGRLRDTLAILLEGTNEKQLGLEKDQKILGMLRANGRANLQLLQELEQIIAELEDDFVQLRHGNMDVIDRLSDRLHNQFPDLCITDVSEAKLAALLTDAKEEAAGLFEVAGAMHQRLLWLRDRLQTRRAI
jgi:DNA-binding response OmpR family regulator